MRRNAGADAEQPDGLLGDKGQRHEEIDGAAYVLDARGRAFRISRRPAAPALVRWIENQRQIALRRQALRVHRAGLLLHGAARSDHDNGWIAPLLIETFRQTQVARDVPAIAVENDLS